MLYYLTAPIFYIFSLFLSLFHSLSNSFIMGHYYIYRLPLQMLIAEVVSCTHDLVLAQQLYAANIKSNSTHNLKPQVVSVHVMKQPSNEEWCIGIGSYSSKMHGVLRIVSTALLC
jgi:hypothetical protein